MARTSPAAARYLLAGELLRLREKTALTAADIARRTGITPSTITRIERDEWKMPQMDVVARLLDAYDADDRDRQRLLDLAGQALRRGWWHPHRTHLSDHRVKYVGLEAGASVVRVYNPVSVPELLRTPAYAEAIWRVREPGIQVGRLDTLRTVHNRRREILFADDPLYVHAIIGEGALRRMVGGPNVMRDQLEHLLTYTSGGTVTLQVIPFAAGALPTSDSFSILTLPGGPGPDPVLAPSAAGDVWARPEDARRLAGAFEELVGVGASVRETRRLITACLADLD